MSEPKPPKIEWTSEEASLIASLITPLLLRVLVGLHFEGEGVAIGCCGCRIPAGLGRLRWTADDEARGRSDRRTVGKQIRCMVTTVMPD